MAPGEHHRKRLHGMAVGARGSARSTHQRPRLHHRTLHSAVRRRRPLPVRHSRMSLTARHPDVVVVGAGIVGAACAAALAREGLQVMLVDADFAGSGSTGVGMGHIVVLDDSDSQLALTTYSRARWAELAPALPSDCEDERRGTMWIAANDAELAAARTKAAIHAK